MRKSLTVAALLSVMILMGTPQEAAYAQAGNWPAVIVDDPALDTRREILLSHGINPEPGALITFLNRGFNPKGTPEGLPATPELKLQVISSAIEELGLTAATTAVPVLMDIAERRMPEGVTAVIRRDFEGLPIDTADEQFQLAERVLSLNAIVALGLIGDVSAAPAVIRTMDRETSTGFITRGAEALALMGSSDGLEPLVQLASDPVNPDSYAAFQMIFVLTGRNYGYTENTSIARRRQLIADLNEWFNTRGRSEPMIRSEILRRQGTSIPTAPTDPTSLRGVLRSSSDFTNYDRRYDARQELVRTAPNRFDEFRLIAMDVNEELDIRRAAIRWMAISNPKKAKSVLKRLRKDENPEITETVRVVEEDLPEYERQAKQ